MKNFKRISKCVFFSGFSLIAITGNAYSQSCDAYPYQPMSNVIEFDGANKFKLISTAAVPVEYDDPTEVSSARREAELLAKRSIAEYINQRLNSEDSISTEINKSKTHEKAADGTVVTTGQRDEVKKQLIGVSSRSDAVLKGTVTIGSCYTKGHEVRVTVGIKSQTIENANKLGKSMGVKAAQSYDETVNKKSNTNNGNSNIQINQVNTNVEVTLPPSDVGTRSYNGSGQLNKF